MRYTVSKSFVQVVGAIWQPGFDACAMSYDLNSYDLGSIIGYSADSCEVENCGMDLAHRYFDPEHPYEHPITREGVERWLDTGGAGDFRHVTDFRVDIELPDGPNFVSDWQSEESEIIYNDAMYGGE